MIGLHEYFRTKFAKMVVRRIARRVIDSHLAWVLPCENKKSE